METKATRKLALNKETVRVLSEQQLEGVNGGAASVITIILSLLFCV